MANKPSAHQQSYYPVTVVSLILLSIIAAHTIAFGVEPHQIFSWYLSYDCGYISRGLTGSIVKLLYGESPAVKDIVPLIEVTSSLLLPAIMLGLWALLILPLWTNKYSIAARWQLLAFATLLMAAPLWKFSSYLQGHIDLWVFACVLLATAGLFYKKPLLFAAALVIGTMLHRLMLPYALLLYLLLLHALYIQKNDSDDKRRWLLYAGISLAVIVLLQVLGSVNSDSCSLLESNYPNKEELAKEFEITRSITKMLSFSFAKWTLLPDTFWVGVLFFGMPSLIAAGLFIWCCYRLRLNFTAGALPAKWNIVRQASYVLLPLTGAAITLPMHFVAGDWSRIYYWSWLGLAIVIAYYIKFLTPPAGKLAAKKDKKTISPALTTAITAFVYTAALTYSSTPLIWSNLAYPQLIKFDCRRFCFFPITSNPLGDWWGRQIYNAIATSAIPFYATGKELQNFEIPGMQNYTVRGNDIIIPADTKHYPLILEFTMFPKTRFNYKIEYESAEAQPFFMTINKNITEPTRILDNSMEWEYDTSAEKNVRLIYRLYPQNKEEVILKNVSFTIKNE